MNPGAIALAELQQADGWFKPRPVVVLGVMPPFSDYLVCAVSSKLHRECAGFDEVVAVEDDDFATSGLKVASLIRLGMVATIPASAILGQLGSISPDRLRRLRSRLARHIEASGDS